jgi:hypothetical protein
MTQSQSPIFFLTLLTYYSKFAGTSYQPISAADFGRRGDYEKHFHITISTKSVFIQYQFWGLLGGPARKPPPP